MKKACLQHIIDPFTKTPFELTSCRLEGEEIIEGTLTAGDRHYSVLGGVPRIIDSVDPPQKRTNATFSDKWTRFKNYGFEQGHLDFLLDWYVKKLGFEKLEDLKSFYASKKRILEAGPGSGFNSKFMAEQTAGEVFSVDISEAAQTTYANTRHLRNCHVVQSDLMNLPFPDDFFDFIIADGVLHHTPDTRLSLKALHRKLSPGGQMFFYVYRRMGPARAFIDQYIRERFTKLGPEECYEACEGLTELGRELSRLKARVKLEKPIEVLGIPAGEHDVQRLLHYYFVKSFWNDAFDYETNNMVNFDWYHPHLAWQQSEEEVTDWLRELGIEEFKFNPANPNGLSVLYRKPVKVTA